MFYAYVLRSLVNHRFYYGSANDLVRRVREHNLGLARYTKLTRPFELVYYEEFKTLKEARQRELFFKSGQGRLFIKEKLGVRAVA